MDDREWREIDEVIRDLAERLERDQDGLYMDMPDKVARFQKCCDIIGKIVDGGDAKAWVERDEPWMTFGSVSIVGRKILVKDPVLFLSVLNSAQTFEVYPKTDGTVQINMGFDGLSRKVGE